MKSEKAKEFIDKNEMATANLVDKDGCGWAVVGIYDAKPWNLPRKMRGNE